MVFTKTITLAGSALSSFLAAGGQTVNPGGAAEATTMTQAPAIIAPVNTPIVTPVVTPTKPTTSAVAQVPFPTVDDTTTTSSSTPASGALLQASTTMTAQPQFVTLSSATPMTTAPAVIPSTTSTSSSSSSSYIAELIASSSSSVLTSSSLDPVSSSISSSSSARPLVSTAVLSSAAISSLSSSIAKSSSTITRAPLSTRLAAAISSSHVATSSAKAVALASTQDKKSSSGGLSGAGIAGLVIGLLVAFFMAALFFFFWKRRQNDKKAAALARRERQSEKGVVRLEENEVSSPAGNGQGFDFGNLPAALPTTTRTPVTNEPVLRSASPAQMVRGAAVLGIQRPFTPPPGHPAHPNYRQPPAIAAGQKAQQQGRTRDLTSGQQPQMRQAPRRVPSGPAPPMPVVNRSLSSNNPFNDPIGSMTNLALAPALAHTTAPLVQAPTPAQTNIRRKSVDSFIAGDDSFEAEISDTINALKAQDAMTNSAEPSRSEASATKPVSSDQAPEQPSSPPTAGQPLRTKSVIAASDTWAARKQQLRNNLALQSNPSSPEVEQSPFADPAPSIDHEIAVVSPMNIHFPQNE